GNSPASTAASGIGDSGAPRLDGGGLVPGAPLDASPPVSSDLEQRAPVQSRRDRGFCGRTLRPGAGSDQSVSAVLPRRESPRRPVFRIRKTDRENHHRASPRLAVALSGRKAWLSGA